MPDLGAELLDADFRVGEVQGADAAEGDRGTHSAATGDVPHAVAMSLTAEVRPTAAVLKTSLKYKIDLRTAAYIEAIDRVATVTRLRGMYA